MEELVLCGKSALVLRMAWPVWKVLAEAWSALNRPEQDTLRRQLMALGLALAAKNWHACAPSLVAQMSTAEERTALLQLSAARPIQSEELEAAATVVYAAAELTQAEVPAG